MAGERTQALEPAGRVARSCATRDRRGLRAACARALGIEHQPLRPPTRRWRAGEGFDAAEVRSYGWVQEYDPRSYGELLRTHSDHRLLDPRRLDKLVEAVENAIE